MHRDRSGRYAIGAAAGERVRSFVPHPLRPAPSIDLGEPRQRLLEQASVAMGRLGSAITPLPDA